MTTTIPVDIKDAPAGYVMAAVLDAVVAIGAELSARMTNLEDHVANLTQSVDRLETAVRNANFGQNSAALQEALDTERAQVRSLLEAAAAADASRLALAATEDAEDVVQNADLQAAVDRLNAAQAETDAAADRIDAVSTSLEEMVTPAEPGTEPEPTPDPVTDPEPTPDPTDPGTNVPDPTVPVVNEGEPDPNAPVFPPSNN